MLRSPSPTTTRTPLCPHRNSRRRRRRDPPYLGMVMHLVLMFCVVMAFSSSSSCPVFLSFFTRLLTAFSHHFSSWPFCSPFFQPSSRLTMGGVNGRIDISSEVLGPFARRCRESPPKWTRHASKCSRNAADRHRSSKNKEQSKK